MTKKNAEKAKTTEKKLKFSENTIQRIAAAAHEAVRIYAISHNLKGLTPWKKCSQDAKKAYIERVKDVMQDKSISAQKLAEKYSGIKYAELTAPEQWGFNLYVSLVKGYIQ